MVSINCLHVVAGVVLLSNAIATAQDPPKKSLDPSDAERTVQARITEIQNAAQTLDPNKVFSFVLKNDNGALVEDGKLFLTREDAFQSTKQGFEGLGKISYRFEQQHITLLSPTVALAVGEGVSSATTNDGRKISTRFAQSVVFKLTDGEWKVYHAHRSFPATK